MTERLPSSTPVSDGSDAPPENCAGASRGDRPTTADPQGQGWGDVGHPQARRQNGPTDHTRPPRVRSQGWGSDNRQAYAAIDLGTNNCRLLIAKPSRNGFVIIDAFSRVVRLGEGIGQTGKLSESAMDRAVAALAICADKLKRRHIHLARSVATEACRRAANGMQFIERVRRETGIVLDIISPEEEARLAVLGCHFLLEQGSGPALVFDIGGGSTELVLVEDDDAGEPRIVDWQSVPWGVVSLTESEDDPGDCTGSRLAVYERMRARVRESFAPFAERLQGWRAANTAPEGRLLGTSGTVTTLASLHLNLAQYDRRAVDGLIVPSDDMRRISGELAAMSIDERRTLPCIGRERADLVVAGCAILEAILDIWPAAQMGVADRGIREGILRNLMHADEQGQRFRQELLRQRRGRFEGRGNGHYDTGKEA